MVRELTAVQPLPPGDHGSVFRGPPDRWLPDPRHIGPSRWRIALGVGGVERFVQCTVGDPWTTRDGLKRRLRWVPLSEERDVLPVERLLPTFDGELFLVGPDATASLLLTGDVEVPLGWLGEAVDAMLLGRAAQRTASTFLQEVAEQFAVIESAVS